jgi:hypothetical protein
MRTITRGDCGQCQETNPRLRHSLHCFYAHRAYQPQALTHHRLMNKLHQRFMEHRVLVHPATAIAAHIFLTTKPQDMLSPCQRHGTESSHTLLSTEARRLIRRYIRRYQTYNANTRPTWPATRLRPTDVIRNGDQQVCYVEPSAYHSA